MGTLPEPLPFVCDKATDLSFASLYQPSKIFLRSEGRLPIRFKYGYGSTKAVFEPLYFSVGSLRFT